MKKGGWGRDGVPFKQIIVLTKKHTVIYYNRVVRSPTLVPDSTNKN